MKTPPVPKEEQIRAMLEGRIYDLLREYIADVGVDFRRHLNVTRDDIEKFVEANPSLAKSYFDNKLAQGVTGGETRIEMCGTEYCVLRIDHGAVRGKKSFKSLYKAVAEHVLVVHGMY